MVTESEHIRREHKKKKTRQIHVDHYFKLMHTARHGFKGVEFTASGEENDSVQSLKLGYSYIKKFYFKNW